MESVCIVGTGSFLPPKVLSNDDLRQMGVDTSNEWIVQRTGIRYRLVHSSLGQPAHVSGRGQKPGYPHGAVLSHLAQIRQHLIGFVCHRP